MAMMDYGAIVKKNGKVLPSKGLFNNYSTLDGGIDHEVYEDITVPGVSEPVQSLVKIETIGDESARIGALDENEKRSVIHNFMAVVGDKDFLVATYKEYLAVFDSEKRIAEATARKYDVIDFYRVKTYMVQHLDTPFGPIKIKTLDPEACAIASFWYKEDYYEILFGYGIDKPSFMFSKDAKRYINNKKVLGKIQRWINRGK